MNNKHYFLETYDDGWFKAFVVYNWILCFGFGIGQLIKIKEENNE